ncbi:MAG: nicotinamide-nucleotide adenylyltransferase [Candidatus Peregrinibacteria bacterium]
MKTGLFIGRFQPFHLGHLSAIRQALEAVDFLHIGIGSAQESGTEKNPFTAEERAEMIANSLAETGIPRNRFDITPIPDINNNPAWPGHVRKLIPDGFTVVFVGEPNALVRELFEKYDNAKIVVVKKEIDISATEIRKRIRENRDWQKNISTATAKIIAKSITGIE